MIENFSRETLIVAVDSVICAAQKSGTPLEAEVVAVRVLKQLDPELFLDANPTASAKRNECVANILPVVAERRAVFAQSEHDINLDRAIAIIAATLVEHGIAQPEPESIAALCFRALHSELLGLRHTEGRRFGRERMRIILGRVLEFQNARVSETGLLN